MVRRECSEPVGNGQPNRCLGYVPLYDKIQMDAGKATVNWAWWTQNVRLENLLPDLNSINAAVLSLSERERTRVTLTGLDNELISRSGYLRNGKIWINGTFCFLTICRTQNFPLFSWYMMFTANSRFCLWER